MPISPSLRGWRRIGIVLSVLWLIGIPIYWLATYRSDASEFFKAAYNLCQKGSVLPPNGQSCLDYAAEISGPLRQFERPLTEAAVFAIGTILLAWLVAYVFAKVARWIRAGFGHNTERSS